MIEPDYWRLATSSRRHWHFIHDSLCELQARFDQLGQPFYIRTGTVTDILSDMRQRVQIDAIYAHEETGNLWTYNRDEQVRDYLYAHHIPLHESPSAGVARRFFNRDKWAAMRNQRISSPRLTPPQSLPSPLPEMTLPAGTLPAKDDPLFGPPITTDDMTQAGGRTKAISLLTSFWNIALIIMCAISPRQAKLSLAVFVSHLILPMAPSPRARSRKPSKIM